jgi:hypothetical protein
MTIFSTPRPLFDGIMFLTACDVDFILKCEWIHISGGSMWNVYLSKTKVHHEMTHSIHNVCRTLSCVHRKKLFEFLKYNNICSLTAILNESISKLCGYPRNMHKFEERWKLRPVTSHSYFNWKCSARGLNEWRFTNQNTQQKVLKKKNSFCMEINSLDPKSFL